jgi:hypothetical protein
MLNPAFTDFAAEHPGTGAAVSPGEGPGAPAGAPSTDEAVLMYVLRLLNQHRASETVAPVPRAFVVGARAMFSELIQICDDLLKESPKPPVPPPAAEPSPASITEGSTTGHQPGTRPARRRKADGPTTSEVG